MFTLASRKDDTHQLDEVIAKLIDEIALMDSTDEAYAPAIESLRTLMEARTADKAAKTKLAVSNDVIVQALTHLVAIGMILGFEKANVITSKALGFVPRTKS